MFFRASKFFLYASVFAIALVTTSTLFPFIVGKYTWFRAMVDLAAITFLLGVLLDKEGPLQLARLKSLFRSPVVLAVSAFAAVFVLAALFGVRPGFSFWSNFERGEGAIQIVNLYAFFVLLATLFREERDWRRLIWCSIATATLMILYGVLAGFNDRQWAIGLINFLGGWGAIGPRFGTDHFRFQGSVGNAEYVPGYLIFMIFFAFYLLVSSRRPLRSGSSIALAGFILLFILFSFMSGTRGAFVGMLAGAIALAGYVAWYRRPWRKWLVAGALIAVALVALLVQFRDVPAVQRLPGAEAILRLTLHPTDLADLTTRFVMWHIAFEGWQERPLLGWGPENFLLVFDRHFDIHYYDPERGFGAWFDRAHSTFFDYLAMTGLLGVLSYLAVFICLAALLLRRTAREAAKTDTRQMLVQAAFLGILVTYLVQSTVLFDVLALYLPLFMLFAFAVWYFERPAAPVRDMEHARA